MVRQIFKNKVIAAAGPLPGQLTVQNLQQWTTLRKGRFSTEIDDEVTHLLCTAEQFRKDVPKALKQRRSLHIIHYDWFEFSSIEEKRLPERQYSMRNYQAKERAGIRDQARKEKARRDGEKFVNTDLFHVYHDDLHFPYQVDITRENELTGEKGQRYTLCLWESNAKPHLYWFTAKFLRKKGDSQPVYHRGSPCSGKWEDEMCRFETFFKQKTDIAWEDRVSRQMTTSADKFQYTPPAGGKPVGYLPHSFDYCLEINAKIRGLPWPPLVEARTETLIEPVHCLPLPESCVADLPDAMNDSLITSSEDCESASCPYHPDLPSGRSVEPGTELSQGHRRQSLSPWGEDLSQGHSSRSIQSHPYPGCGSAGLPSPDREMQDSPNLPIDSKGLGYAIDRALRIPAINAVDRDEERKDSTLILRLVK